MKFDVPKRDLIYPPGAGGQFMFSTIMDLMNVTNEINIKMDSDTNEYHTSRSNIRMSSYPKIRELMCLLNAEIQENKNDYERLTKTVSSVLPKNYKIKENMALVELFLDSIKSYQSNHSSMIDPQPIFANVNLKILEKFSNEYTELALWITENITNRIPYYESVTYQSYAQHRPYHVYTNIPEDMLDNYSYVSIHAKSDVLWLYFRMLHNAKHKEETYIKAIISCLNDTSSPHALAEYIEGVSKIDRQFDYSTSKNSIDIDYADIFLSANKNGINKLLESFGVSENTDITKIKKQFSDYHLRNLKLIHDVYGERIGNQIKKMINK